MNNYIDMYNYSFELTYREIDGDAGDTKYREEFLNVFGLKKWEGEQVEKSFTKLYSVIEEELKRNELIEFTRKHSPFPFRLSDSTTLVVFFSFENFHVFHKCMKNFYENGKFTQDNVRLLKKSLEKKI